MDLEKLAVIFCQSSDMIRLQLTRGGNFALFKYGSHWLFLFQMGQKISVKVNRLKATKCLFFSGGQPPELFFFSKM